MKENSSSLLNNFDRIAEAPDAVPRLRRFILALAVRGKLVEQEPSDEPASDLLKRIQEEKGRLVKTGKIRDKPWLPAVTDDEMPFEIPAAWRWSRFANLADFSAGRTPPRKEPSYWNSGEHAWVSIADMEDGQVLSNTKETVSVKARERIFRVQPEPAGTILMSFKLTIGKIARLGIPAFHNEAIISIRPHLAELDRYLFEVLPEFARRGDTKGAIKGATLNRDSISNIFLPIPPLAEQQRIVAKVDELMALCDRLEAAQNKREQRRDRLAAANLNRINQPVSSAEGEVATAFREHARFHLAHLPRLTTRPEHIKTLRQTILNLAVRGRLVPQDPNDEPVAGAIERIRVDKAQLVASGKAKFEKPLGPISQEKMPFSVPEGWAWTKIDTLVRSLRSDIRTGPFGSSMHKEDHRLAGVPVWGIESINKNGSFNGRNTIFVNAEKARDLASFSVNGGDIIISRSGTVGELCRIPEDAPHGLLSTNLMKISLNKQVVSPDYFSFLFKGTESIDSQLTEFCSGSTRLFLTQSILVKLFFPLPPLAEQHRIVAKVDELMTVCDQLEVQLTATQTDSRRLLEAVLHEALAPAVEEAA